MPKIKPQPQSEALTDEAIIARVIEGDLAAFQRIVARYERKLLLYLTHLIGGRDEADDLLQDVFVKAYQYLGSFDQERRFSSWIYRIAHNEGVNWIRQRSRRPTVVWQDIVESRMEGDIPDEAETVEEAWIRRERRDDVRRALRELSETEREILTLRYYLDKSYREISDIVGIPMNTVATRLSRAKKKLLLAVNKE